MGKLAAKVEWEKAAKAEGLKLVEHECPDCHGERVVEWISYDGAERRERCCLCEQGLECPVTGDRHEPDAMAWTLDGDKVVSVASVIGCECCGMSPRILGGDLCPACLEAAPTLRGTELPVSSEVAA